MAFLAPDGSRQPIFRVPGVIILLIALLAAAHVGRVLLPAELSQALLERFAFIPARLSTAFLSQHGAAGVAAACLSLFTYMGLHNDLTHLAINCLWLLAFGPIVARRFGTVLFLVFFIICGVAAAAVHLALNWGSPDTVIGASGAISGLMAAGIRLLPSERPSWDGPVSDAPMLPLLSRQMILFTLVWAALNVLAGFTGFGMAGETGLIAWQAHLGGYAAGLLLSSPFDRLRQSRGSFAS